MWKRIKRAMNSNLGRFKGDPLSSSGPSSRDVKALGESLEVVRSQVALLEKDLLKLQSEETALSGRIRTALDCGNRSEALKHAATLAKVRDDISRVSDQLTRAREVCRKAEGLYGAAGGVSAIASAPIVDTGELDAAAEDTLSRLEHDLISEGKLAGPQSKSVAEGGGKSIADSGPQTSAAKTIGGAGRGESEAHRSAAAKTIGTEQAEPESQKTIGGEAGPAPEAEGEGSGESEAKTGDELLDELERLAKLKEKGVLTDDEFKAAKKKLLG